MLEFKVFGHKIGRIKICQDLSLLKLRFVRVLSCLPGFAVDVILFLSEKKQIASFCREGDGHDVHRGAEVIRGSFDGQPRESSGHARKHRLQIFA